MLDLTEPPVTMESCYQLWVDPKLAHQMRIDWAKSSRTGRSQCQTTVVRCNCGWESDPVRPERPGSLAWLTNQYLLHVQSLL